MKESSVPITIVTQRREDAEFINKTMRDAGHAVRCQGISQLDKLESVLKSSPPHLLMHFADVHKTPVADLARLKQRHAPSVPLIVVRQIADDDAISDALSAGAQDLVTTTNPERLRSVCVRELGTYRQKRALKETLQTIGEYKQQIRAFMADSTDAIAQIQEGIVVEANQAWADLFAGSELGNASGPLMDHFASGSQAELKDALVACHKGQWRGGSLRVEALTAGGKPVPVTLELKASTHDGEAATRLRIRAEPQAAVEREPQAVPETPSVAETATDPATGLLTRQKFLETLTETLEHAPGRGARALAFVRPDRFGDIGRAVGPVSSEDIIAKLGELFAGLLTDADVAGRFGGTVFTIILERDSLGEIQAWAENALDRVANHLFEVADRSISLTCTLGLAEMGSGTDRVEQLLTGAERAARRGRRDGGNRVVLEETADESTRIKRVDAIWVQQIRAALVEGRFRLVHLNIANLSGQSERMLDTVIRMVDAQGDEVPAADFIATAGRNKLLRTIDRWVIDATLAYCARHANDLIFVKLSHESILDASLLDWVLQQTGKVGVKPQNLCFQVSEDVVSQYQRQTVLLADRFRDKGYRFAIEHFGIGRDPLRVLTNTPMDFVKFDGSLMKQLAGDFTVQEKLRAFVTSAANKNIRTIAERVENANTMAILFQLGVGYMQGHYLHEPEVVLEEAI